MDERSRQALGVSIAVALCVAVAGVAAGAHHAAPRYGSRLLSTDFARANGPNHLITNEWAFWNRDDRARVASHFWQVTSGSLFSVGGVGATGVPDMGPVDRFSQHHTGSQIFRMTTARSGLGDVVQAVDVRVNGFVGSSDLPIRPWYGVVLWPRYVNEFHLYFAYMLRRDGRVAITKKCPGAVPGGNFYNGGSYFHLARERYRGPLRLGRWYRIASSVEDQPDGTVTIRVFVNGRLAATARDAGVGCPPIRDAQRVGIRADDTDASFAHYRAYELSPLVATSCPDAFVGERRQTIRAFIRRVARRIPRMPCPADVAGRAQSAGRP